MSTLLRVVRGAVALAAASLTLFGAAGIASADEGTYVSLQADDIVLTPAPGGGYAADVPITVSYQGPDNASLALRITNSDGIYFNGSPDGSLQTCVGDAVSITCYGLVGHNGMSQTVHAAFRSLTAPTALTRHGTHGRFEVLLNGTEAPGDSAVDFEPVLAGTDRRVQPGYYHPAAEADLTVTAQPGVATVNPSTGHTEIRIPATLLASTDALHEEIDVRLSGPVDNLAYFYTDPFMQCYQDWQTGQELCKLPGGPLPQYTTRDVTVIVVLNGAAPASIAVNAVETGWTYHPAELNPADNTVVVPVITG